VHTYEHAKLLANQKRAEYGVATETLNLNVVRRIYSDEGIRIDKWDFSPSIRAVYMCDDGDISVAVSRKLPREPYMFALVHELKHHFTDIPLLQDGKLKCGDFNANELIKNQQKCSRPNSSFRSPNLLNVSRQWTFRGCRALLKMLSG
jgi:hypothetical protein